MLLSDLEHLTQGLACRPSYSLPCHAGLRLCTFCLLRHLQAIKQFVAKDFIRPAMLAELWDVAAKAYGALAAHAAGAEAAHRDLRATRALLSMAAAAKPQAFGEVHLRAALKYGFCGKAPDALLTRHACVLLQRLGESFETG